jgi:hypothetical protein
MTNASYRSIRQKKKYIYTKENWTIKELLPFIYIGSILRVELTDLQRICSHVRILPALTPSLHCIGVVIDT